MTYIQHFGSRSDEYLNFRPQYPTALFDYIVSLTPTRDLAWDCGTGNGQAAIILAEHFKQVVATDVNQSQLEVALKRDNISYECSPAEQTNIPSHTVNLITVAQALHWFNFDPFYQEAIRVAAPNALLACWCYGPTQINSDLDQIIKKLYLETLGDRYWPKERRYIDEAYQTIPFPFPKIQSPQTFKIKKTMNLSQLFGYLGTWSAIKEYQKQNHQDPLDLIREDLKTVWGDPEKTYLVSWPIHLLLARINPN